ncbi:hypothetical protein GCM10010172_76880 [Paractinoplanes ferrugineus]|uniref:Pyrrolo-quinoline quinone repeat domain-containing protein n=2 Tax=Paractinoplanes ferrugineus TaxID=113564 RepID=A0A919J3L2_9ACTN|nr:hypothetical protein Afe05nite_46020 [Actinoplanes ferrugineus]
MILTLAAVLAVSAGCMGSRESSLADDGPLTEKWRLPAPLPATSGPAWQFTDTQAGLIGQGRRLVSIDVARGIQRWVIDLPPGHPAVAGSLTVTDQAVVARGTSSVLALSLFDGHTLWARPGRQAAAVTDEGVVANCSAEGCDLTGVDMLTGTARWTRRMSAGGTLTGTDRNCGCVYFLAGRTLTMLDAATGSSRWTLTTPAGAGTRVLPSLYRAMLFTPPTPPSCTATFRGVADGTILWTRAFHWRDPARPAAACTYDPARLLTAYDNPRIPVDGALETLDSYSGMVSPRALDPGEYLLTGDYGTLTWTPGAGYRSREGTDVRSAAIAPPDDNRPWGTVSGSLWLVRSGAGLTLYSPFGGVRWTKPTPGPALISHDRLVYLDGTDLVALGPPARTD